MHDALANLAKKLAAAQQGVEEVLRELEAQSEREAKRSEQAQYGDDFDPDTAQAQEAVVEALAEAIQRTDAAAKELEEARAALREA